MAPSKKKKPTKRGQPAKPPAKKKAKPSRSRQGKRVTKISRKKKQPGSARDVPTNEGEITELPPKP